MTGVTPELAGSKAYAARQLQELSRLKAAGFKTPRGLVIPFGVMETLLTAEPVMEKEYYALVDAVNKTQDDFAGPLKRLREIVNQVTVPVEIASGVMKEFTPDERLIVRSSSNCEDLENSSGAGLYDSVANVPPPAVDSAIREVWASLWNKRAVMSRRNTGIPHDRAHMAVLIQEMIVPEFSFIMHTINPVTYNKAEVYIELAVGLGETLAAAGTPGVPYRMLFNKQTDEVRMLAFASFSHALWPGPSGGTIMKTIDYSDIGLSKNKTYRDLMGGRLGSIGQFIERALGHPQDLEGVVSGNEVYLVQSRAQQGNV
jgi:phosphoglucan,water dikinase